MEKDNIPLQIIDNYRVHCKDIVTMLTRYEIELHLLMTVLKRGIPAVTTLVS